MKRIEVLLFCMMLAVLAYGQSNEVQREESYEFFIDVALKHGKEYTAAVAFNNDDKEWICDENGNKMKFKNKSNVINLFTKLGWTFVQINTFVVGAGVNTVVSDYMLLKKSVKSEAEARQGINLESDFRKK